MKRLISSKHFSYKMQGETFLLTKISKQLNQILAAEYYESLTPILICQYKQYFCLNFEDSDRHKYITGGKIADMSSTEIGNLSRKDVHAIMKIARNYYFKLMHKHAQ